MRVVPERIRRVFVPAPPVLGRAAPLLPACTTVRIATSHPRAQERWINLARGDEAEYPDTVADLAEAGEVREAVDASVSSASSA